MYWSVTRQKPVPALVPIVPLVWSATLLFEVFSHSDESTTGMVDCRDGSAKAFTSIMPMMICALADAGYRPDVAYTALWCVGRELGW